MGVPVTHIDDADTDECLMTGSHKGADGASILSDPGADFKSCGAHPDLKLLIKNVTDGSEGEITASTEDTVIATLTGGNNDWDKDDVYVILKTATEDSIISTHYTDKRFGRKVTNPDQLDDGIFPEDVDLDDDDEDVFGPGQPERIGG